MTGTVTLQALQNSRMTKRNFSGGATTKILVPVCQEICSFTWLPAFIMLLVQKGPSSIYSAGQLAYWKDGRDVPDVTTSIMDYAETPEHPAFQVMLRVNFISGDGGGSSVKFIAAKA